MMRHYVAEVKSVVARDFDGESSTGKEYNLNQSDAPKHSHGHHNHTHNHKG